MNNPYMRSTKEWDAWREGFKMEQLYWEVKNGDQKPNESGS